MDLAELPQGAESPLSCACASEGREGDGTPLQYSCLENPRDGGAWWAAVHGVARVGHDRVTSLSLSRIGEGNGNPLQCSCLENPRDGGAWWAAVSVVAQSRTRLKRLSSSSSSNSSRESEGGLSCSAHWLAGSEEPASSTTRAPS